MRTSKLAWALTLGLALALTASAVSLVAPSGGSPAPATQDSGTDAAAAIAAVDAPPTNFIDPWPTDGTVAVDSGDTATAQGDHVVTIALAARWGYLNDPAVAVLEGRWRFNDTRTGGAFLGQWHLVNGRVGGYLDGHFSLPRDGHGRFRGEWNVTGDRTGGYLWGAWVRLNDTSGYFDGSWNFTSGRAGGALAGRWALSDRGGAGGGFRGQIVAAPSIHPVDWDGSLSTTNGTVHLARTIRFERNDRVLPQRDRSVLAWESTTTVNWDGVLTVLRIADPGAQVTLHTAQVSFTWTARELPGLHVHQVVDRAGHAIEVRGFLIQPPSPRPCECAKFAVGLRWGNLSSNGTGTRGGDETNWNGFAQITYGGLDVFHVVSFERTDGDLLLPRDNRVTVSWLSNTDPADWDGVGLGAIVPLRALNVTYFTVHAGDFTHVFTLRELLGHHVFDVGNGNQVEVRAARL